MAGWWFRDILFLSTLSARRATAKLVYIHLSNLISIHALREESDLDSEVELETLEISIHALREESDLSRSPKNPTTIISIHALREESDGRGHFN